jgi:DNA invertase Pin-like site-specific DNA recombinase
VTTAPHMTMTTAMAAAVTAAAATDERNRISARRRAGILKAAEAGPRGLLSHGRNDKSAHKRRDRYCNQSTSHDLPLHVFCVRPRRGRAPHLGPGLINKIL